MVVFLFILESIGTSELILIGIVALIFLGPRKLPEIARKLGKIMADLRNTTAEFKETWEREVNFEEEAKVLKEMVSDVEDSATLGSRSDGPKMSIPEVKPINTAEFGGRPGEIEANSEAVQQEPGSEETGPDLLSDKRNWL